ERDEEPWPQAADLRRQPRAAGLLFCGIGPLVQAQLAARLGLEVLDGVGEIERPLLKPRLLQSAVEQLPGGTHERHALQILLQTRLLTDQHDLRACRSGPEDGLRGPPPQRACPTIARLAPQYGEVSGGNVLHRLREKRGRRGVFSRRHVVNSGVRRAVKGYWCRSSIQRTNSGASTGVMSRLTTRPVCPLRASTQCSCNSSLALISWCGTYGGT